MYEGVCLETQKSFNSVNVLAWRDEVIPKPGQTYEYVKTHRFTAE